MNIAELINECGVDNARIQFLDQCADQLDYNIKSGTRITFGTTEPITPNGTVKLGIVVWLPRDAVKAAIAMEARQGGDGETRLHPKDDSAGPQDIAQEGPQ